MKIISGTLVCHRYANLRRGSTRTRISRLLADCIAPLPPSLLWCIQDEDDIDPRTGRAMFYRTKSGKLPAALDESMEGQRVTIGATVTPWKNGIGGWISRITLIDRVSVVLDDTAT